MGDEPSRHATLHHPDDKYWRILQGPVPPL